LGFPPAAAPELEKVEEALRLLKEDFVPVHSAASAPSPEQRDKKLDRIVELLSRLVPGP
jgi:hypothetical protein